VKIYLVGGAVRDHLLGREVSDRDYVVVGGTEEEMLARNMKAVGNSFPIFLCSETGEEYALARTERKSGRGYTGFHCYAHPDVTLEEDLLRRDLTINAMAMTDDGRIIDPYGGQEDLAAKRLVHVSEAFAEDPLRVLRCARFAAQLPGFTVDKIGTLPLMKTLSESGELDDLPTERLWKETEKALRSPAPERYFEVLRECGALAKVFPEIDNLYGIPQPELHHPEIDTGVHTMMVLAQAAKLSDSPVVRFAALVHDLGKALTPVELLPRHHGHEDSGAGLVEALCARLKVGKEYLDLGVLTSRYHLHVHKAEELKPKTVHKILVAADAFRRPERLEGFLLACEADARGRLGFENRRYPAAKYMRDALSAAKQISAKAFAEKGLSGADIGENMRIAQIAAIKNIDKMAYFSKEKGAVIEGPNC
jgi:tRNA nucleotidyltransferase (CCA-adding enzyme)